MALSSKWLPFELFMKNTGPPLVMDSSSRSTWVKKRPNWSYQRWESSHRRLNFASHPKGEGGFENNTLMSTKPLLLSAHPIKPNECKAHSHKYETQCCETCGLKNKRTKQSDFARRAFFNCCSSLSQEEMATYLDLWS